MAEDMVSVPRSLYERLLANADYLLSDTPTTSQIAAHLRISTSKVLKDAKVLGCPLQEFSPGGRGRGKEKKFLKSSVTLYKKWLHK